MLSLGLSITSPAIWRKASPYDPATDALFAALTGSYSDALKLAINDAIISLKTLGAWDDFDVLYPIGAIPGTDAANADDSRLNWKSPGNFTAIPVNAPTHGNGYWQGDGSSSRLRTQYTPSVNGVKYTRDEASMAVWSQTNLVANVADIGGVGTSTAFIVTKFHATSGMLARLNDITNTIFATADSLGMYQSQRTSSNAVKIYKNGSLLGTNSSTTSNGIAPLEQWICGANNSQFSSRKVSLAWWGASQTGRESSLYTIFQTLFTAAGTI